MGSLLRRLAPAPGRDGLRHRSDRLAGRSILLLPTQSAIAVPCRQLMLLRVKSNIKIYVSDKPAKGRIDREVANFSEWLAFRRDNEKGSAHAAHNCYCSGSFGGRPDDR